MKSQIGPGKIIPITAVIFLLAGCVQDEPMSVIRSGKDNFVQFPIGNETPRPTRSDYFITKGGGFGLQLNEERVITNCTYFLILVPRQKLPTPFYFRVRFENPTNREQPVVVNCDFPADSTNIVIRSPNMRGFQSGHSYLVDVSIYNAPDRSQSIDIHEQFVQYVKPPRVKE